MMTEQELVELYEICKPFMEKEISFEAFCVGTRIIEQVKTEEDGMKLARFIKGIDVENQ